MFYLSVFRLKFEKAIVTFEVSAIEFVKTQIFMQKLKPLI